MVDIPTLKEFESMWQMRRNLPPSAIVKICKLKYLMDHGYIQVTNSEMMFIDNLYTILCNIWEIEAGWHRALMSR